jgi:hypothetical protein
MTLIVFVIVAVLIALILLYAAARSDILHVQRSLSIGAPPEKIFALIDDFHNWSRWAPQDQEDSTVRRTYSGPACDLSCDFRLVTPLCRTCFSLSRRAQLTRQTS